MSIGVAIPSLPADSVRAVRLTGCHFCGTVQRVPAMGSADLLNCAVCDATLARTRGRSMDAALACAAAALLLLAASAFQPVLTSSIFGVSRESRLASSASVMQDRGYPDLAVVIALFVIVLPLVRMALLTAVLGALRADRRPGWIGPAFRHANALQTWAMADVFVIGAIVAIARLRTQITVEIGYGAWCYAGAALLALLTRATLDVDAVWHAIAPEPAPGPLAPGRHVPALSCPGCNLLLPDAMEGAPCPRCAVTLRARKRNSIGHATALTLAAVLLYLPANLYPIATLPIGINSVKYTVLNGVIDLIDADLYGLGLLVFVVSFAIPLAKLAGLTWCIASVLRRSGERLKTKTRVFTVIEEIGRWSMLDPFVIATFVPITQYNALVYGRAEPAAPAFAAVVILTTLAANRFDARLMWDAARSSRRVRR